jgi:hypothetical protein
VTPTKRIRPARTSEVIDGLEEVGIYRASAVCEDRVADLVEFPLDLPLDPAG